MTTDDSVRVESALTTDRAPSQAGQARTEDKALAGAIECIVTAIPTLSDCFVVAGEEQLRHGEAERLGSLEIDHQLHECLAHKPKERTMGKAAFNERLKLAATYWNNISAGLMLTGLILPYLALNYWIVDLIAWVPDWLDGQAKLSDPAIVAAVSTLVATVAAYVAASVCRSFADRLLTKIQD